MRVSSDTVSCLSFWNSAVPFSSCSTNRAFIEQQWHFLNFTEKKSLEEPWLKERTHPQTGTSQTVTAEICGFTDRDRHCLEIMQVMLPWKTYSCRDVSDLGVQRWVNSSNHSGSPQVCTSTSLSIFQNRNRSVHQDVDRKCCWNRSHPAPDEHWPGETWGMSGDP